MRGTAVSAKKFDPGPEQWQQGPGREAAEDAALLAATARGDATAYRSLVDRHLSGILGLARHMLRDDAAAEDVAQETLLRLWRNSSEIVLGPYGLRPWLRRVASNLCIDRSRSGRRLSIVAEVPEVEAPADQLDRLESADTAARVDTALKALPERQRLALTLFHFEGLSQIEIGQMMGISDEAVESLLARARRTLKKDLQGEWRELLERDDG
jgi:RNA polymerase sigma-70 factor (ECF subfamily)